MSLPKPHVCTRTPACALSSRFPTSRSGVTLVEMLIALTLTLVIMAAVVTLFGNLGESVNDARAAIEMGDRLRTATTRLRNDLANATATMAPPRRPEYGEGYLEYYEGGDNDYLDYQERLVGNNLNRRYVSKLDPNFPPVNTSAPWNDTDASRRAGVDPTWGDTDDILALTIRAAGAPFVTNVGGTAVESSTAEVAWFVIAGGSPAQPSLTLYRRQLLVAPIVDSPGTPAYGTLFEDTQLLDNSGTPLTGQPRIDKIISFRNKYDLSHRIELPPGGAPGGQIVLNNLGDLTKRENRFMHGAWYVELASDPIQSVPPYHPQANTLTSWDYSLNSFRPLMDLGGVWGNRRGEDVMLTGLKAFDLQVFDATVEPRGYSDGTAPDPDRLLLPSDPGYWEFTDTERIPAGAGVVQGGYVDLGFKRTHELTGLYPATNRPDPLARISQFSEFASQKAGRQIDPLLGLERTYDTYSYHYEIDGLDTDNRDGDNNVDTGADEGAASYGTEMYNVNSETEPPYRTPLAGLQVRVRVYEPDSRQVRQVTVSQDYAVE